MFSSSQLFNLYPPEFGQADNRFRVSIQGHRDLEDEVEDLPAS